MVVQPLIPKHGRDKGREISDFAVTVAYSANSKTDSQGYTERSCLKTPNKQKIKINKQGNTGSCVTQAGLKITL